MCGTLSTGLARCRGSGGEPRGSRSSLDEGSLSSGSLGDSLGSYGGTGILDRFISSFAGSAISSSGSSLSAEAKRLARREDVCAGTFSSRG